MNDQMNSGLAFKGANLLDLNKKYKTEEIMDRICLTTNGKGLDWWKQNPGPMEPARGSNPTYEWFKDSKRIGGWYGVSKLRLPLYVELHKRIADELRQNMEKNGVQWNYDDYATLPKWIPSHIHADTPPYDLIEVTYMQNTGGYLSTNVNPWLAEINEKLDPYGAYVWINEDTAKAKGIGRRPHLGRV